MRSFQLLPLPPSSNASASITPGRAAGAPPNGACTSSSSGAVRVPRSGSSFTVPVIGARTAAPSMLACSDQLRAVVGHVEEFVLSRETVTFAA